MEDLLRKITNKTRDLWYEVNKKYGNHVYTLGVNGLGKIELAKGYTKRIVVGTNTEVQKVLKDLLNK